MSWTEASRPDCPAARYDHGVLRVISPRPRDIGAFEVRRVLPASEQRRVGPFVFWDQMGPAQFAPGRGMDVRPHPHIGLATITYLFDGEIHHRDSLGSDQIIRPGDVNWMTAGRGIVHSERSPAEQRGRSLFGIQSWVALPTELEETEPAFVHFPESALPVIEAEGSHVRLIAGTLDGRTSPVATASTMLYADVALQSGARWTVPAEVEERAVHVAVGEVRIGDEAFGRGQFIVLTPGHPVELEASMDARVMVLGGAPVGSRHLWWNFVSSRPERIERAKADWREGRFAMVPGDDEFIPLPD
jgi:hypothetical protein